MKIKHQILVKEISAMLVERSLQQVNIALDTSSRSLTSTVLFACLCEVHASQKSSSAKVQRVHC